MRASGTVRNPRINPNGRILITHRLHCNSLFGDYFIGSYIELRNYEKELSWSLQVPGL